MADTPSIPPIEKDAEALRELARREAEENIVDQQAAALADAADRKTPPRERERK